jgi:hypothetical protein
VFLHKVLSSFSYQSVDFFADVPRTQRKMLARDMPFADVLRRKTRHGVPMQDVRQELISEGADACFRQSLGRSGFRRVGLVRQARSSLRGSASGAAGRCAEKAGTTLLRGHAQCEFR